MTDTALFSSVYGFALLLVGLALTAYQFNRIRRQRRQRIRVLPQRAPAARAAGAAMRGG